MNPAPVAATWEILTLPVPVFVNVMACDAELPTRVLPKLRLLTLEESKYDCAGAGAGDVPVPETLIVPVSPHFFPALTTMLPLYVSAAAGRNATLMYMLLWGLSDIGKAGDVTRNSGRLLNTC